MRYSGTNIMKATAMDLLRTLTRIAVATALIGSLGACVVAPPQSAGYRGPSVYVETYPTYRYGYPSGGYYGHEHRHYDNRYYDDNRGGRYYGDDRRYSEPPRRMEAPIPGPAQVHRDIRRSLGLPRLPGMP